MNYKFKYLKVTQKAHLGGMLVRRMDVGHLNKKGRELEWDKLDQEYPSADYVSCYEQSERELPTM